jgi:hypothetical protein
MEEGMEEEQGGTEESRTNQLISVDVIDGPLPRFFQAMDSSSIALEILRVVWIEFSGKVIPEPPPPLRRQPCVGQSAACDGERALVYRLLEMSRF